MPHVAQPFWNYVDMSGGLDACWPWTGALSRGYGQRWVKEAGRIRYAHQLVLEQAGYPVPVGMEALHDCDNRACCNPLHLSIGTPAQNMADSAARGRSPRGERNTNAKLTADQVRAIRAAAAVGESTYQLAKRFGVTRRAVVFVVRRTTWRHV